MLLIEFYWFSMWASSKVISLKMEKLKESIVSTNASSENVSDQQILNGSARHRFFMRVKQLDHTLALLLIIQLLLLHCYVKLTLFSTNWTSREIITLCGFWGVERCVRLLELLCCWWDIVSLGVNYREWTVWVTILVVL